MSVTFEFSVQAEERRIGERKCKNGLFSVLQRGYSDHLPIAIRPDDILNTIGCIWAKYVILNAERLRAFFVQHDGKKVLQYESHGTYCQSRLPEFMSGLTQLIKADQENDNLSWLDFSATTTAVSDRLLRSSAMLASQKEYYEYRVHLACGFPSVTLLGTDDDWESLEFAVQSMPTPDESIGVWQSRLLSTIAGMRGGEEAFWQRCVTNRAYGSGPRDYDGWILTFNPFTERGQWMNRMEDDDILDLTVDFEIHVDDNGRQFRVDIEAGPGRMNTNNGRLCVTNTFYACEAGATTMLALSRLGR